MKLGSFNSTTNHYECLRALTPREVEKHVGFLPWLTEARDRLALFRMLNRNYAEWRSYLDKLLSATFKEEVDVSEELNRLLLNYLTFAYTIQEHFSVSLRQRFKKEPRNSESILILSTGSVPALGHSPLSSIIEDTFSMSI